MTFAFPDRPTITAGDDLVLHVATAARAFRVVLVRFGAEPVVVARSGWFDGVAAGLHLQHRDWSRANPGLDGTVVPGWPAYRVPTGAGWRSGVYVAVIEEGDGDQAARADDVLPALDARSARALFVVRSAAAGAQPAPILYKVPLFTYHAYDRVVAGAYDPATQQGGWCLYDVPPAEALAAAVPPAVSWRRPGGGTGGTPWDITNWDPFAPTLRQTFAHWDARFVAWLERAGYVVECCTDLDVHEDAHGDLLRRHRLLVSAGHDEYWSDEMRAAVEGFVADGGNVAFFGGNTCWWRITFDDAWSFRRVGNWSDPGIDRPENTLTGVSFRHGGERDRDEHPEPVGYRVQHADHWVFAGTGLADGDVFGAGPDEYVVGYECDGAHFDRAAYERGDPAVPSGEDGTPASFTILGVGDVRPSGWGNGNAAATMGLFTVPGGGTVFNAATTDWARLLGRDPASPVERITRNVLDGLSAAPGSPV